MTAPGAAQPHSRLVDLASDAPSIQESAWEWFLEQGDEGVPLLLEGLRDDRLGSVGHWRILLVLRQLAREETIPSLRAALRQALDRGDAIVLPGAMEAIAVFRTPDAARELIALLDHPNRNVVKHAAVLVGQNGSPGALAPLQRLLTSDDPSLRYAATQGLLALGTPEARAALAEQLARESDAEVRELIRSAGIGGEGR